METKRQFAILAGRSIALANAFAGVPAHKSIGKVAGLTLITTNAIADFLDGAVIEQQIVVAAQVDTVDCDLDNFSLIGWRENHTTISITGNRVPVGNSLEGDGAIDSVLLKAITGLEVENTVSIAPSL